MISIKKLVIIISLITLNIFLLYAEIIYDTNALYYTNQARDYMKHTDNLEIYYVGALNQYEILMSNDRNQQFQKIDIQNIKKIKELLLGLSKQSTANKDKYKENLLTCYQLLNEEKNILAHFNTFVKDEYISPYKLDDWKYYFIKYDYIPGLQWLAKKKLDSYGGYLDAVELISKYGKRFTDSKEWIKKMADDSVSEGSFMDANLLYTVAGYPDLGAKFTIINDFDMNIRGYIDGEISKKAFYTSINNFLSLNSNHLEILDEINNIYVGVALYALGGGSEYSNMAHHYQKITTLMASILKNYDLFQWGNPEFDKEADNIQ